MRILLVEDERSAARMIAKGLREHGYAVDVVGDGASAIQRGSAMPYDIVVLDILLPVKDGLDVCRELRSKGVAVPVLMLTARDAVDDRIAGLDAGADDYVVKPFDPEELRARVQVGVRVLTLQERLAERVAELQAALSNVKQLHGLLPICSYCKRIRGDDQYWQQVEAYITDRSEAQFSHGICPACYVDLEQQIESYKNDPSRPRGARDKR